MIAMVYRPKLRFRLRTFLLLAAGGPIVLWAIAQFGPVTVWDGGFDLGVRLVNETEKPIDQVQAMVVGRKSDAELYVSFPEREHSTWKRVDFDHSGLGQIYIRCSGHDSCFTRRELRYWQPEAIALRVDFSDGSQSLFAVDVPERGKRNLEIRIPFRD